MPVISLFYGITIRMYWYDTDQHKQPHVHAYYGDDTAVFSLDGDILAGKFPRKQSIYVKAWILLHQEDLSANWILAVNGEDLFRIDPLK